MEAADPAGLEAALARVLKSGRLTRIPKHPGDRALVMAMICVGLRRRYPYSERELNDYLRAELEHWLTSVDHVSLRRYLIDLGFVKRDRAGARYFVNFPKLEETLSAEAREVAAALLQAALAAGAERRRRHGP